MATHWLDGGVLPIGRYLQLRKATRLPVTGSLIAFIIPLLILALWVVAAERHWMSPQVLPTPSLVAQTAYELVIDNLWSNLWISLQRLVAGLLIGVAFGAVLGGIMGLSRRMESILYPTFIAVAQIPTLAWIPMLMMLLGLGEALKVIVIVKAVIMPVTIHTHVGVRDVDARLAETARALRLSHIGRLLRLTIPASLPAFLTGLRLALAQAWTSLLAVELLASSEGIGFLMVWGRQLFQLDIVFVTIFVIGGVGLVMDRGFHEADRRLVRWPRPALSAQRGGPSRGRTSVGWRNAAWTLLLPLGLLLLWSAASAGKWVDPRLLPTPWLVFHTLQAGFADGALPNAMIISLQRTAWGLLIGGSLGFLSGLALGLSRSVERLFGGTLTVLRLVAIFAWLPLLTAWVGLGEPSKIAFIAIACFFPLQVATQRGVANLSLPLAEVGHVLRLGLIDRLRRLVLPGAAPAIFAGLRLSLIQAWIATMGAEYFMTSGGGIGSLMVNTQQLFQMEKVVAAMLLIGAVAAAIGWAGKALEAHVTRWRAA